VGLEPGSMKKKMKKNKKTKGFKILPLSLFLLRQLNMLLLVFLLAQFGSKMQRLLFTSSNTDIE
jgi:hypothetical protein